MSYPAPYTRTFSFSGYQAANPLDPLPGQNVDIELDTISNAMGAQSGALKLIQRSDGKLANGSVAYDQLDPRLAALLLVLQGYGAAAPPLGGVYPLRMSQLLLQIAATVANGVATVNAAISASPDDPARIQFDRAAFVAPTDAFAIAAQTALGLSNTDWAALLAAAVHQPG